ncbi:MAG: R2-like ligand-binding oxidase [Candidatus Hydrogenedentes bacterium]|nr:R2-like ligand-binding oxidase [Candidatus Hydrogenedentota bacterium]
MGHESFATTTRGLNRNTLPMRLFEKAKRLGIWNPADIDFSQDRADWAGLSADEQQLLLRLTSQFQAGEEAVTLDLLPLMETVASEGRIEEEMFLTAFLWEEAKHVDFFSRFIAEVVPGTPDLNQYVQGAYRKLFYEILPEHLGALRTDKSAAAQVKASTVYNMVVEGMLAETGYHTYYTILDQRNILPGCREGISKLKLDESRHIAYGVYLISRHVAADPAMWDVFQNTMTEMLPIAMEQISEVFGLYAGEVPFGLKEETFMFYAQSQFQKRFERVQKSLGKSLEEITGESDFELEDVAVGV